MNFGVGLSNGVQSGSVDGLETASGAFDIASNIIDNTPLGTYVNKGFTFAEHHLSKIERTQIIDEVKQKYQAHISKAISNKMTKHAISTMALPTQEQLSGISGNEWLEKFSEVHANNRGSAKSRFNIKMNYYGHMINKRPFGLVQIPLSFVPMPDIAKKVIDTCANRLLAARKQRKQGIYTQSANKNILIQQLGEDEYLRKKAKWDSKNIADLGQSIQRNLFKLKQAVMVLNERKSSLNQAVNEYHTNPSSINQRQLSQMRDKTAMALFEVQHYIEKITEQGMVLEKTVFTVNTYLQGLEQIVEGSKNDILNTF